MRTCAQISEYPSATILTRCNYLYFLSIGWRFVDHSCGTSPGISRLAMQCNAMQCNAMQCMQLLNELPIDHHIDTITLTGDVRCTVPGTCSCCHRSCRLLALVRITPSDLCYVLCCAVLCCAVLCCAVLCCAVLCCDVMCCDVLSCAVLCCAVQISAFLQIGFPICPEIFLTSYMHYLTPVTLCHISSHKHSCTGKLRVFGSGNNQISFCHVDNYCHGLMLGAAALYPGSPALG
jgi:hypothetical protein